MRLANSPVVLLSTTQSAQSTHDKALIKEDINFMKVSLVVYPLYILRSF
jgi:hypothetical protein